MFINFHNQQKLEKNRYSKSVLANVLETLETKNKTKIASLIESFEETVAVEEVLHLFSDKMAAMRLFSTFEAEVKPGPDPYMRDLDDEEKEDKEEQMKDQAEMDDDDPDAYKEMPGDEEAREKGEVKTSKHTKAYADLYGEDLDEGVMSDIDLMVKKHKSFDSFEKEFFKEYGHKKVMKRTPEFLEWLKALYNDFDYMSGEAVEEAMDMNDPILIAFRAAKMKREREMANPKSKRKPLYGKQRRKAENDLWNISQDLKDLYADRGQMLIDMEQEAEPEGGAIADEYGGKLNTIEDKIQALISKRNKLEIKLAESFEVNEATKGSVKKVTNALAKNYKGEGLNFIAKVYQDAMEDANFHRELDTARGIGAPSKWRKDVYDIASSLSKAAGWNGYLIAQGVLAFLKELGEDKAVDKFQRYLSVYDLLESKMPIAEAVDTETVIQIELEDGIYYIKPYGDSTHFYMSTMKDGIENAIPAHIGQHRNRPYYNDLRKYLKGGKDIDGNSYVGESYVNEGKNDYMARYGKTDIMIKKGYKVADEGDLEDLYVKLGELAAELGFGVKNITVVTEGKLTWEKVLEHIESVEEDEQIDEMTYGQLERCVDYAKMIRDRFDEGYSFDSWMHSKVNCAKKDLNSVFDALDGGDGEIEEVQEGMNKTAIKKQIKIIDQQIEDEEGGDGEPLTNETLAELERERERLQKMLESNIQVNEDLKNDVKKYIKKNQKDLDDMADTDQWDQIYTQLYTDFNVDPGSDDAQELKTVFTVTY